MNPRRLERGGIAQPWRVHAGPVDSSLTARQQQDANTQLDLYATPDASWIVS